MGPPSSTRWRGRSCDRRGCLCGGCAVPSGAPLLRQHQPESCGGRRGGRPRVRAAAAVPRVGLGLADARRGCGCSCCCRRRRPRDDCRDCCCKRRRTSCCLCPPTDHRPNAARPAAAALARAALAQLAVLHWRDSLGCHCWGPCVRVSPLRQWLWQARHGPRGGPPLPRVVAPRHRRQCRHAPRGRWLVGPPFGHPPGVRIVGGVGVWATRGPPSSARHPPPQRAGRIRRRCLP